MPESFVLLHEWMRAHRYIVFILFLFLVEQSLLYGQTLSRCYGIELLPELHRGSVDVVESYHRVSLVPDVGTIFKFGAK